MNPFFRLFIFYIGTTIFTCNILMAQTLLQKINNTKQVYRLSGTKITATKNHLTVSPLHLEKLSDDQFLERIQFDYTKLCLEKKDSVVTAEIDGYNINLFPVAVKNGWIDRKSAAKGMLQYLKEFYNAKTIHGFFPRSFNRATGEKAGVKYWNFGKPYDVYGTAVITASLKFFIGNFFQKQNTVENGIRSLCAKIIDRVDWNFAFNEVKGCFTWFKNGDNAELFDGKELQGIWDETFFIQLLALSDKKWIHGLEAYNNFTSKMKVDSMYGYRFYPTSQIGYAAQSFLWFDLRNYKDSICVKNNLDYFTSIRNAVLMQKACTKLNPNKFQHYGKIWGIIDVHNDKGDIQLEEVISSINFDPDAAISCLRNVYEIFKTKNIYSKKGLHGKVNVMNSEIQSLEKNTPWYGFYLPLNVLYIENYRSGLLWKLAQSAPDYTSILLKAAVHVNPKK